MYLGGLIPTESHLLQIILQTVIGILVYSLISLKVSPSEFKEVKVIAADLIHQVCKNKADSI